MTNLLRSSKLNVHTEESEFCLLTEESENVFQLWIWFIWRKTMKVWHLAVDYENFIIFFGITVYPQLSREIRQRHQWEAGRPQQTERQQWDPLKVVVILLPLLRSPSICRQSEGRPRTRYSHCRSLTPIHSRSRLDCHTAPSQLQKTIERSHDQEAGKHLYDDHLTWQCVLEITFAGHCHKFISPSSDQKWMRSSWVSLRIIRTR